MFDTPPQGPRVPLVRPLGAAAACLMLLGTGCATKKYVRAETATVQESIGEHIRGLEGQIEDTQGVLGEHAKALVRQESAVAAATDRATAASTTANEALDRALEAGKLAEGKFLYEVILTDQDVEFSLDSAELTDATRAELDRFADELKKRNENVFVEIQGHTCSLGEEQYNLQLGEKRAAAVRRYLNMHHGFALHRMSVISYGESAPVAGNESAEDRARNRRVALVVLS